MNASSASGLCPTRIVWMAAVVIGNALVRLFLTGVQNCLLLGGQNRRAAIILTPDSSRVGERIN